MSKLMDVLQITPRLWFLPVVHGSGDSAIAVRRWLLDHDYDCLAVPLPPSFREAVLAGVEGLPVPRVIVQREANDRTRPWESAASDRSTDETRDAHDEAREHDAARDDPFDDDLPDDLSDDSDDDVSIVSYVPIDPCQPVIAALRTALGEHKACAFIDRETESFEPTTAWMPDPYALKQVRLDRFAAAILPSLPPPTGQLAQRIAHMAERLRALERQHRVTVCVGSVLDWPWIRQAFLDEVRDDEDSDDVQDVESYGVDPQTLMFLFGELPFITGLYERARDELEDDENLSVDGIKELLLTARSAYYDEFRNRARRVSPQALRVCLKYMRNLSLLHRRLTPDLYTIVMAAKQVNGDGFAVHVAEISRLYPYGPLADEPLARLGIDRAQLPDGTIATMKNRLQGHPMHWRSCELQRRPHAADHQRWAMQWNPYGQCSWPPEDERIEHFRAHVMDRAREIMGTDLARTEKFSTSVRDGIDIRDTLRNWHTGDIYVRVIPPARGTLDTVVMLFDSPADPRDYPWRATWFAEHHEESTLAFFGTDFRQQMVGPGIGLASYGGAMFLYPPVAIHDIWTDPQFDFCETLEERLLAAACVHSRHGQIALLSSLPPGAGWRRLASRYRKKWVHVPLSQFGDSTIQQLRMVHVLNGKQIRSFAAHFIRKP